MWSVDGFSSDDDDGVPDRTKFECPIYKIGVMEIWDKGK